MRELLSEILLVNKNIAFLLVGILCLGFFLFSFYFMKFYTNNVLLIITLTYCNQNFDNMFCVTFANLRKYKCSMGLIWCQQNSTVYGFPIAESPWQLEPGRPKSLETNIWVHTPDLTISSNSFQSLSPWDRPLWGHQVLAITKTYIELNFGLEVQ